MTFTDLAEKYIETTNAERFDQLQVRRFAEWLDNGMEEEGRLSQFNKGYILGVGVTCVIALLVTQIAG